MGLAERRACKQFETDKFPALKAQIDDAVGCAVPIEVDWTSLQEEGYAHMYDEAYEKVYFEPLIIAFKAICADAMGKDALQAALKKIVIKNTGDHFSAPSCFDFSGNILTFDHKPVSNVDDVKDRANGLQEILEKAL